MVQATFAPHYLPSVILHATRELQHFFVFIQLVTVKLHGHVHDGAWVKGITPIPCGDINVVDACFLTIAKDVNNKISRKRIDLKMRDKR